MVSFNLLTKDWIPVQQQGRADTISLKRLLCNDEDWQICLSRDDMEMATLQLIVCIVQVVFLPDDKYDLKDAYENPMSEADYEKGIEPFIEWFDLLHHEYPFMQRIDVKASKIKSPQALLTGLPEKTSVSASFFNDSKEVTSLNLELATIALFNRAINAPSEGGGFKHSLRGSKPPKAPMNVLIAGNCLRQTIWYNILTKETVQMYYPNYALEPKDDLPTWIDPIVPDSEFYSYQIGFRRGLFWQPSKIMLVVDGNEVIGMKSEKMKYKLKDEPVHLWLHPHSPKKWIIDKEGKKEMYISFSNAAPAWTQLTAVLVKEDMDQEGHQPPLIITQYRDVFRGKSLQLIIGGYRNNQAKIEQRRHELLSISQGWDKENGQNHIKYFVSLGLKYKTILRKNLYGLAKKIGGQKGLVGLSDMGEELFYQQSESLIHAQIAQMEWQHANLNMKSFQSSLNKLCMNIFDQLVLPYEHDPKFLSSIVVSRARLNASLKEIGEN